MSLFYGVEKIRRLLIHRVAWRRAVPVRWHIGRPNFGDDINPTFFSRLAGVPTSFAADQRQPHLLGAGSILDRSVIASVVCGAGFLQEPRSTVTAAEIVAVRGTLSLAACGRSDGVLLGDPLILVDSFMEPVAKRHRFGFVPHVRSVGNWRRLNRRGWHIIDPGWSPWRVVEEIAACEIVFSQSLHGLIVADALGIPNVWVAPSDAMVGGRFKFDDYFSTLDRPKEPFPEIRDLVSHPRHDAATVGRYRFSKADYRRTMADACRRLAERLAVHVR